MLRRNGIGGLMRELGGMYSIYNININKIKTEIKTHKQEKTTKYLSIKTAYSSLRRRR